MAASVANFEQVLKTLYTPNVLYKVLAEESAFAGLVPKSEQFTGFNKRISIAYAPGNGRSRVFATAQTNSASSSHVGFLLTRVKDYAIVRLETELILASKGDAGSVADAMMTEVDMKKHSMAKSIGKSLYTNFGGAKGRVGGTSTTTLTLLNRWDVINFEVGDIIDSDSGDGTSGAVDGDDTAITGVDREAGTLTAAANWTTGGNFADNDYLFHAGDFGVSISGLDSWLPSSAPGATAFFGVDRSVDPVRLGGLRYVASAAAPDGTIERTLINAAAELQVFGGRPSHVFMNPIDWRMFVNELGTKTYYEKLSAVDSKGKKIDVGYKALMITTGHGDIAVISDPYCPKDVAYMLDLSTWKLHSLGGAPRWLTDDGAGRFLRRDASDALEARLGMYGNLATNAPGHNCRIDLSALTA